MRGKCGGGRWVWVMGVEAPQRMETQRRHHPQSSFEHLQHAPADPRCACLLPLELMPYAHTLPVPDCHCTVQSQIDAINGWEVDRTMEQAMESLRCPPSDALVANLSGGTVVGGVGSVGG